MDLGSNLVGGGFLGTIGAFIGALIVMIAIIGILTIMSEFLKDTMGTSSRGTGFSSNIQSGMIYMPEIEVY